MATKTDDRSYEDLEQAVIAGDSSITAEQLSTARERDRLVVLQRQAEERARREREAAEREAELAELTRDMEALPDNTGELRQLAAAATEALAAVFAAMGERDRRCRELASRAKRLGVPEVLDGEGARHSDGIGWSRVWSSRGVSQSPGCVHLGGRQLAGGDPWRFSERIIADAREQAGLSPFAPGVTQGDRYPEIDEQLKLMDRVLHADATVAIRLTRSGRVQQVTASHASHVVRRGWAEYA